MSTMSEIDEFAQQTTLMPHVIEKMRVAIEQGKEVVTSTLSSEGDLSEMILCTEIFEMDEDDFFLNAFDNYW